MSQVTECCGLPIAADERYCSKCGWEARAKNRPCQHVHGEYRDDYRHCTECGREWVLISGDWFEVEAWVRICTSFLAAPVPSDAQGGGK